MSEANIPWSLVANSWQYTTIYDADEAVMCRLDLEDWDATEETQDDLEKHQASIARQIVRAVNAHDALVEALEAMVNNFEPFRSKPVGAPHSTQRIEQDAKIAAYDAARAALKLARGET